MDNSMSDSNQNPENVESTQKSKSNLHPEHKIEILRLAISHVGVGSKDPIEVAERFLKFVSE